MNNANVDPVLSQSPTINPYIFAASLIWRRLKWDLNPESWQSRKKIGHWKNRYANQKAVIVCNGPSLLKTDFSLLEETFSFGLNKINLLFDKSSFRPSCIVAINPFVIEQNKVFFNETDIPLFLDSFGATQIKPRSNVSFLHSTSQRKFAQDCSISINQGYTVTFVAMQLAFHMGFSKVALIGCDHNFAQKGPANMTVVAQEKDESHFDPKYFADGVKWQLPDLDNSEVSYRMAKDVYNAFNKILVNCTEGGKLEVFPRMSLVDFIQDQY